VRAQHPPWKASGASWSYWPGAWQSPRQQAQPKERAGKPQFPPYDATWMAGRDIVEIKSTPGRPSTPAEGAGLVSGVQHVLNHARKVEQKLNKARAEMSRKSQAWDAYVVRMQQSYAKEKKRHVSEQERLSRDIGDLDAELHSAYALVKQTVLEEAKPGVGTDRAAMVAEWEALMQVDEEGDSHLGAELKRILEHSEQSAPASAATTPARRTGVPPMTPAPPLRPRIKDTEDDTGTSPRFGAPLEYPTPPTGPSPVRAASPPKVRGENGGDVALSMGDAEYGHVGLADRISEKRRATRSALAPFGVVREAPMEALTATRAGRPPPEPGACLLDDDADELTEGHPSPGLGKLE